MSKYHSKKTVVDGIEFHSKKEANRWKELLLLERAGVISNLRRQVLFELIPAYYEEYERYSPKTGKRLQNGRKCVERGVMYVADFVYMKDGKNVVEDTKGVRTTDYIIKRKLMRHIHGVSITEV